MQYRSVAALIIAVLLLFCQLPVCAQASDGLTIGTSQALGNVIRQDETYPSEQDTEPSEEPAPSGYAPLDVLSADHQPDAPVEITLTQNWVIEDARGLITLNPQMSSFTPEDIAGMLGFPGISQPVTIYTNGFQIIIKDGGSLLLQEWDAGSAQLCVEGEHPDGLFRVEGCGTLELHQVYVKTSGTAVMLCEDASYTWSNANERDYPEPVAVGIKGFEALELSSSPKPLRVYDDTPWSDELAAEHQPVLSVYCGVDGVREEFPQELKVVWDTSSQAESLAARQDCVLTGTLYDENDQPVESRFIPELQVLFRQRSPVEITKAAFEQTGAGNWFGDIRFTAPAGYESIILEVSEDDGESWSEAEGSAAGCKRGEGYAYFFANDDRSRLYRIVVEGGPNSGSSEAVILPEPQDSGNSGSGKRPGKDSGSSDDDDNSSDGDLSGNRGGGTAIDMPDRNTGPDLIRNESEEASRMKGEERPQMQNGHPTSEGFLPERPKDEQAPCKSDGELTDAASAPADTEAKEQSTSVLPKAVQAAVAAAGVTVCAGSAGMVCSATLRSKVLKWVFRLLRRG